MDGNPVYDSWRRSLYGMPDFDMGRASACAARLVDTFSALVPYDGAETVYIHPVFRAAVAATYRQDKIDLESRVIASATRDNLDRILGERRAGVAGEPMCSPPELWSLLVSAIAGRGAD